MPNSGRARIPGSILLVDDDAGDRLLIQNILKSCNSELGLHYVEDGEEALSFLKQQGAYADAPRPHLVLLDLNLPRKDGSEVLAEIRADPDLAGLPVIILSTSSAPSDIRKSYSLHANAFVSKPGDLNQLRQAIQNLYAFWFGTARLPGP
ncbi:response regulator [Oligoflexus tunisiensis]|uniref:response regulator n=1 Tax=Oligoflexus tunisiensis TaxID=708132 RepID=UPI000AC0AF64|nr:response regulator [Oligoflexus tunisiensis]